MLSTPSTPAINKIWRSGIYIGDHRPITRVTIQWATQREYHYKGWTYRSVPMNQVDAGQHPRELPNIKSCQIVRSIDQDAATATFVFYNIKPLPLGQPIPMNWRQLPGWYSPNHATNPMASRWKYTDTHWQDWLVPDRILRTYQGYGIDRTVTPDQDTHLVQTGVWIIDKVNFTSTRLISVTCRDLGALLLEQDAYKPVIPANKYPISFESTHTVPAVYTTAYNSVSGNARASFDTDSNYYWDADGIVYGHSGRDAFDSTDHSYWLSIGNGSPNASWSYEWVQAKVKKTSVNAVRFRPKWGNYRVYISVYANGAWQGSRVIPYAAAGVGAPNGSAIPYVKEVTCGWEKHQLVELPRTYPNVTKVRLTLTNLYNSGLGRNPYRGAIRDIDILNAKRTKYKKLVTPTKKTGNYSDYTEIVKLFCAVGGFYWPRGSHVLRGGPVANGYSSVVLSPMKDDSYLGHGSVWGDFENAGTSGPTPIPVSAFDKKTLMECVTYVKEILGFLFHIDESGAAIFRSPNIWQIGNFVNNAGVNNYQRQHVKYVHIIDEREVLVDYAAELSNANKRSSIYIGNVDGKVGARISGYEPIPSNKYPLRLLRLAMWTDQHFDKIDEARMMADLVKLRQMFKYRVGKVSIPANPSIQMDDQVRVIERVTGEGYIHYVAGVTSDFDAESGRWSMTLDTFWLGTHTYGKWLFNPSQFNKATQDLLEKQGHL